MFKLSFESATYAGLMAAVAEAANSHGGGSVAHTTGSGFNERAAVNVHPNTAADPDAGPVNVNAPSLDSSGLPWDERIHAATKATVADGTWRKKRGVDAGLVASVEMELRQKLSAASLQQNGGQQFQQQQPQQFQQPNVQQQNFQQQQPAFNPNGNQQFDQNGQPIQPGQNFQPGNFQQQQPNVQPPQQFQAPQLDFAGLMQAVSTGMAAGTLNNTDIPWVCSQIGVANIAMLQNDPDRVQQAVAILRNARKIQ